MEYLLIQQNNCSLLTQIISLCISVYAASLSWQCNTGMNMLLRITFSAFAFVFGITYLICYAIFRYDECKINKFLPNKV